MLLHSLVAFVKRAFARVRPQRRATRRRMQNFELLEGRGLLSAVSLGGAVYATYDLEANNTLDTAQNVGGLNANDIAAINGLIGEGTGLSTDADWYSFSLAEPASVHVDIAARSIEEGAADEAAAAVVSLYGGQSELWEAHNPLRHSLLTQVSSEDASGFDITLGAGTYFVAVTGAGNRYYHPFLADSGLPGTASEYEITLATTTLAQTGSVGAQVLGTNIESDAQLTSAPSTIRIRLDRSLDESLIADGDTVQLFVSVREGEAPAEPNGVDESGSAGASPSQFNDVATESQPTEQLLSVGYWSFSYNLNELTLLPQTALKAGHYRLVLSNRLLAPGEDAASDFELNFDVIGQEGCVPFDADCGDDTIDTATDLGDALATTTLQVTGTIGDDPAYDPYSENIALWNRASDVDLFRFTVTGEGQWSFIAEAFAGRFGSPLDPSLTLLQRMDDGSLELVHFNGSTQNPAEATNGTLPLYTDSVLYAGLTAGEYFIAVSSATNDPEYGPDGVFNPTLSHSGLNGVYTGDYVLNLSLTSDNEAPSITGASIVDGTILTEAPRSFTVSFSEMVNLQQAAAEAYLRPDDEAVRSVFIRTEDGSLIYPRFDSYDATTQTATFLLLDGLPNGAHELHLPAGAALTDLAGNGISANDESGDYVIRFSVDALERGIDGNANVRDLVAGHQTAVDAQDLGTMFPRELESVVIANRSTETAATAEDTDHYIRFEVLQTQFYFIALRSDGEVAPSAFELFVVSYSNGAEPVEFVTPGTQAGQGVLRAGQYLLHVGGWTTEQAAAVTYHLEFALAGNSENPTPLTSGAASAIGLRLTQASSSGTASVATTFVRPQLSLPPRIADSIVSSNASASATTATAISTPSTPLPSGSQVAVAMPSRLNQGFIARPLGSDPASEVGAPTGPTETMLVKLWEQPTATKLFALLDDELPSIHRTRRDVSGDVTETTTPTDETSTKDELPQTESSESAPTGTNEEASKSTTSTDGLQGDGLQDRPEPAPTALDRILRQVNQTLKSPDSKNPDQQVAPDKSSKSDPQARQEAVVESNLLGAFAVPIGLAYVASRIRQLRSKKTQVRSTLHTHVD